MRCKILLILAITALSLVRTYADTPAVTFFKPVVKTHKLAAHQLSYTSTVGIMPIYNKAHELIASMSYIAYSKTPKEQSRPISFIYAGGPGSSSLTQNFLVSGPKIIPLTGQGKTPKHSALQENPETWLNFTDLVYVDMVGTGFGRVANEKAAKTIFTPSGDAKTFSQFILRYLTTTDNFNRKIYLVGESYGGFRTPLVMNDLLKKFVSVQGALLISPVLDANYSLTSPGSIIAYPLFLPTFIRAAIYHKRLATSLMTNPEATITEGINWAFNTYLHDLFLGEDLSKEERAALVNHLSAYTGLSKEVIENNNYRITKEIFRNSLLKNENKSIDYIDARVSNQEISGDYGFYVFHIGSFMTSQLILYPKAMQNILTELGVATNITYINYFDPQKVWDQGSSNEVISVLHDDLIIHPTTRVFVGMGYYDMDVPYYVTKTAIRQLLLPEKLQANLSLQYYLAGHMFYTDPIARGKYYSDVERFYAQGGG